MPTTQLVRRIVLTGGRTLDYEYDAEERITKVTDSVDGVTEYTYDALGQLLTEAKDYGGRDGEYFRFYNSVTKDINDAKDKKMSIVNYVKALKKTGATPLFFVSVNEKKGWW